MTLLQRLARFRVPLGFLSAAAAFALARPSRTSVISGLAIAAMGEAVRVWAAGHIEKGRENTTTGPYRFVRHPLYLGSAILAIGFIVAARSVSVAVLVGCYMALTLVAAMRTEEAALDARFPGAYTRYKAGEAQTGQRRFSWARVWANREYRALTGFAIGFALLGWMATRV